VQAKWKEKGSKVLDDMIRKSPARFAEMVAKLMPQEHSWDDDQAEGFLGVLKALGHASRSRDE
jgi:hypothetical protein